MTTALRRLGDRRLAPLAGLVLLLAVAVVHGLWTDRWNDGSDLERALARLDNLPREAGAWTGRDQPLDDEQADAVRRVGVARLIRRQFTRPDDPRGVSVVVMGGRFGPLAVHTPDVCYGGAGYVMAGKPACVEVSRADGVTSHFWTARFHRPAASETPPLRLFWGWNSSEGWQAPDNPRWAFRMKPVLYKLYVAREMNSLDEPLEQDPGVAFLRDWLPELDRTFFD